MFLKQYYLGCLAHASYLIGDERTKQAMVVDPQRDIEQYLKDAAAGGYTIKYVALTHSHADFLAGHIELRNRAGAQIVMGKRAQAEFEFLAVKENDELNLGDVRIRILETPDYFVYDAIKNRQKRPDLDATLSKSLQRLSVDEVVLLNNQGA